IDYFYYEQGTDAVRRLKEDFPWLVTRKSVDRLLDFCNNAMVLCGGRAAGRLMEPTIINDVSFDDPVMKEEIFGPVLPILTFDDIDDMTRQFHSMEKPLALYYFGRRNRDRIISSCSFGGGCVNDTIMHLTEQNMPFGGVGHSGMGSYHGRKTFDTFTHYKSVLSKNALYELSLKYQPYTPFKLKLTKKYFGL
ncbi:MAG: aldehyde dehydrogenase family protein, partial [Bacteroidales bacterium]|nr:aldehyde dehydrogenase family protein [Bacteroidales bacterium]